jgi:hypothetical protein
MHHWLLGGKLAKHSARSKQATWASKLNADTIRSTFSVKHKRTLHSLGVSTIVRPPARSCLPQLFPKLADLRRSVHMASPDPNGLVDAAQTILPATTKLCTHDVQKAFAIQSAHTQERQISSLPLIGSPTSIVGAENTLLALKGFNSSTETQDHSAQLVQRAQPN